MVLHSRGRTRAVRVGAHLVEFAAVIPVFFIFVFGLIEIGRGMMVSSLVTNASRVGCRTGVLPNRTNSDVKSAVDNLLSAQGIAGYTTTIQVNGSTGMNVSEAQSGDTITVIVSLPASKASWLPSVSFVNGTIRGQFDMPHE